MKAFLRYVRARFFQKRPFKEMSFFSRPTELRKILFVQSVLRQGDLVIDVGAHVGLFSHLFFRCVGESGRVFSYEANPYVFAVLKRWARKKRAITPFHMAISDGKASEIEIAVHPFTLAAQSTVEPQLMNDQRMPGLKKKVKVRAQSLDALTTFRKQAIRLIKIDVEGHEQSVLQGAINLIEQDHPLVIFEYGVEPKVFEPNTLDFFQTRGYVCIDLNNLQPLERMPAVSYFTDLIAIPKNQVDALEPVLKALSQLTCK